MPSAKTKAKAKSCVHATDVAKAHATAAHESFEAAKKEKHAKARQTRIEQKKLHAEALTRKAGNQSEPALADDQYRGLCGPSELRVKRCRQVDCIIPEIDVPFDLAADVPLEDRLAAFRQQLILAVMDRFRVLDAVGGKFVIASLVMEFLGSGDGLKMEDLKMTACRRGWYRGNRASVHASSRSRNVDFFFKAVPKLAPSEHATSKLEALLEGAWSEDPEVCVKLIFHLGAARRGKQDRWNFYDAVQWLWSKSPTTLLQNLQHVEPTIYWKALLEIVARICEGRHMAIERDVVMHQAYDHARPRLLASDALAPPVDADAPGWKYAYCKTECHWALGMRVACGEAMDIPEQGSEGWILSVVDNGTNHSNRSKCNCGWQPRTRLEQAENSVYKYDNDPLYRALHLRTAQLFANQLAEDESAMLEKKRVSLCGKWAPLLDKGYDRRTLVAESIARMLYPPHAKEFEGLTEQHYSYRARLRYADLLNKLKEYRKEPARLLNAGRCDEIKYRAVPGTCMRLYTPLFMKKDGKRFQAFLDAMKSKKNSKLNAGSLQPHELLRTASIGKPSAALVAELQWKAMAAKVKKDAKLKSCIAVCDMSEAMLQTAAMDISHRQRSGHSRFDDPVQSRGALRCLDIAYALSLLLSEVAEHPFSGKVVTFEDLAMMLDLGHIPGVHGHGTLPARVGALHEAHQKAYARLPRFRNRVTASGRVTGGDPRKNFLSAHFIKVFELLLELPDAPEKVFIFSVMDFNAAASQDGRNPGLLRDEYGQKLSAFAAAEAMYEKAGRKMPEVIFWNLGGCKSGFPVVATQPGAVLVSGFSPALIKDILAGGNVDPLSLLQASISAPLFAALAVTCSTEQAEGLVERALALEGHDARNPQEPARKHKFQAGEEWELIHAAVVDVDELETLEPASRRGELLSLRGVRRVINDDPYGGEDALLSLIGRDGLRIKAARDLLSAAASKMLAARARVWIDCDNVGDYLGAIAVTIAARLPEDALREVLISLLMPAIDALLGRVTKSPILIEQRKEAWKSGKLQKSTCQDSAVPISWGSEVPYKTQLEWEANAAAQRSGPVPVFTIDDIVPTILSGIECESAYEAFLHVSKDRSDICWRHCGQFPGPRRAWNPPPREKSVGWSETEWKAWRLKESLKREKLMQTAEFRARAKYSLECMEWKALDKMDHDEEHRLKHLPRGGVHGYPSKDSRRQMKNQHEDFSTRRKMITQQKLKDTLAVPGADGKGRHSRSPSPCSPLGERGQRKVDSKRRDLTRMHARDGKYYDM